MCGRTCLTLEPDQICRACKYKTTKSNNGNNTKQVSKETKDKQDSSKCQDDEGDSVQPEWRPEFNCGRKYVPSHNMTPSEITPVLVSTDHFCDADSAKEEIQSRVVVPMMWGMIPFWHKGDYRKHGLTTNNSRLEHMLESKLYRGPFRRGQRCVVLCEGFYEWQETKPKERAAHFLYMPQSEGVTIYDKTTWGAAVDKVNLLKMAGLFDVWEDENGDKMFSYSVITFESPKLLSWLHHRTPAILETEEQVNDWLDFKRVTDDQALAALRPPTLLKWHRVSNLVNNSRNKSEQCNKPTELVQSTQKPLIKNKTMLAWLNVRKRREEEANQLSDDDESTGGGGAGTTTSESEGENPPKRPRFRDFKKAKLNAVAVSTNNTNEKPPSNNEN